MTEFLEFNLTDGKGRPRGYMDVKPHVRRGRAAREKRIQQARTRQLAKKQAA